MEYQKAYLFLFNRLTDMMESHPELRGEIILLQQQAEDIIIDGDETEE